MRRLPPRHTISTAATRTLGLCAGAVVATAGHGQVRTLATATILQSGATTVTLDSVTPTETLVSIAGPLWVMASVYIPQMLIERDAGATDLGLARGIMPTAANIGPALPDGLVMDIGGDNGDVETLGERRTVLVTVQFN